MPVIKLEDFLIMWWQTSTDNSAASGQNPGRLGRLSLLLLTLGLFGVVGQQIRAEARIGQPFPSASQFQYDGSWPAELAGKVAVIDFWASWCAPCKASFPALSRLQNEFGSSVVIVGVSVDEKKAAYQQFIARFKPSVAVVRDGAHQLISQVKVPTMPTSYVLDRNGVVRFIHSGFHDGTEQELRTQIKQLLGETHEARR
jgi:thiol-disulfide isomerase/thioredoxin